MITYEQAVTLRHGQELHYTDVYNCTRTVGPRGGVKEKIVRVHVSGTCQTWKTRPGDFRIPVKYGLYESTAITPHNASGFHFPDDCPVKVKEILTADDVHPICLDGDGASEA